MSKIDVRLVGEYEIEILSDAKKGDIIDLRSIKAIDLSIIDSLVKDEYKKKIKIDIDERIKNEVEKELLKEKIKLNEIINEKNKELNELKSSMEKKDIENKNDISKLQKDFDIKLKDIENNKNIELLNLKKAKEQEKSNFENNIKNIKLEQENLHKDTITKLKTDIDHLKNTHKVELDSLKNKIENEYIKKISDLEIKLNDNNLRQRLLNTKLLGEKLEQSCYLEFQDYQSAGGFLNCTLIKDNEVIKDEGESKGSKADFIFTVYSKDNESILTNVCCEMKNEFISSTNKKKNSDYFKALDKNRIKKNCQYALLVSELEIDNEDYPLIKKINEYDNMYVVRPSYFIPFLTILYSITIKFKDLIDKKSKEDLLLKDRKSIMEEFDKMKDTYILKPLTTIEKNVIDILKNAETIENSINKIISSADEIINKKIEETKKKIEKFNIEKICKKIDKLAD